MGLPNIIISKKVTEEIIDMCEIIYSKKENNFSEIFPYCNGFINTKNDSNWYNNPILILSKFNSMNIRQYREIYFNITNGNNNINKVLFNYHLIYFIGLLTLFIIHSLYTILLSNIKKQYDTAVTSPSDYAIIITNLQSSFKIFFSKINGINKIIKDNNVQNNNFITPEDDANSSRQILERFKEIGLIRAEKNKKEIKIAEGFDGFIRNVICGNDNKEKYDIYLINICYKVNEYKKIKEKIKEKNDELYKAKHDPEQLRKNMKLNLSPNENNYFYFYNPLDIFGLYICPFTLYEKKKKISEIEKEKQKLEEKLKTIIKNTDNLTEDNFSGVVFIIFNSMKEKDKFLEHHNKNLLKTIINSISNLKYYLFYRCINTSEIVEFYFKNNISIEEAPEPEDIIYENLEFSKTQRLLRIFLSYIISIILIAICFFFILYLNSIQIRQSQSDEGNNIVNTYGISISISLSITVINNIFQNILVVLTRFEKQICMTNYFLSFSIKLTILTFFSSAIIPFL